MTVPGTNGPRRPLPVARPDRAPSRMPPTLRDSQLAAELADALYDFLPGKPNPFANADLSFPGAARAAGVSTPWPMGSKRPALAGLLAGTLERERARFCPLVEQIVHRALQYRAGKQPLTREEVDRVNEIVLRIGFKIPGLHDAAFLRSLPAAQPTPAAATTAALSVDAATRERLERDLIALAAMDPLPRGYAFERFLNDAFRVYGLAPREPFSLRGEQIDGSFVLGDDPYLLEAKWKAGRTPQADLLVFDGKVGGKAAWTRGLFVSYAGFTAEGLDAFVRGRQTRIICMDSVDIFHMLRGALDLRDVLRAKARRAAETNQAFVPVTDLF